MWANLALGRKRGKYFIIFIIKSTFERIMNEGSALGDLPAGSSWGLLLRRGRRRGRAGGQPRGCVRTGHCEVISFLVLSGKMMVGRKSQIFLQIYTGQTTVRDSRKFDEKFEELFFFPHHYEDTYVYTYQKIFS